MSISFLPSLSGQYQPDLIRSLSQCTLFRRLSQNSAHVVKLSNVLVSIFSLASRLVFALAEPFPFPLHSVCSTSIHPLRVHFRHLPLLRRLGSFLLVSTPYFVPFENMETSLDLRRRMVCDPLPSRFPQYRDSMETFSEKS